MSERISAWWTSRSIIAAAVASSPKISPQAENGLLRGDDQAGALVAAADEHEHQVGGLGVKRDVADLVDRPAAGSARAGELVVEAALALRVGEQRDPFGRGAEDRRAGRRGRRGSRARSPGVSCRCPGGPNATMLERSCRKSSCPRCSITCLLDRALEGEVELLQRLAARGTARRGCGPRRRAPRAMTARSRAAPGRSARSSTPPARARSASFGSALAAAGAFSARNRCASSELVLMRSGGRRRRAGAARRRRRGRARRGAA